MTIRLVLILLLFLSAIAPVTNPAGARHVDFDDLLYLEGVSWQVIEHTSDGLIFEVTNDSPGFPPPTLSRVDAHRWLAAPPGSRPVFEALDLEWEIQWERSHAGPLGLHDESRAGETPVDFKLPRGYIIGDFRGIGLISLRVGIAAAVYASPPSYENGMAVLRRGRFAVKFEGGRLREPRPDLDLAERDPYLLETANALFLNASQVPELHREIRPMSGSHPVMAWNRLLTASSSRAPVALLRAAGDGWYEIDRSTLQTSGVAAERWNPAHLAAFVGNEPVSLLVETDRDGSLARIGLWVPPREKAGAEFVPVWLLEADPAFTPQRLSSPPAPFPVTTTAAPQSSRTVFEPRLFSATYPALPGTSRWATATAFPGEDLRVRFDAPGMADDAQASLTVWMGGNRPEFIAKADVHLNGELLAGGIEITGNSPIEEILPLPAGLLRETANLLVVTFDAGPHNVAQEELALSRARIDYSTSRHLNVNSTVTIGEPLSFMEITALTEITSDGALLDITDPLKARWLRNDDELERGRRVTAIDRRQHLQFASAQAITHADILAPARGADMIVIAPESLREAAEEYAAYRRTPQRRVTLLTVEEIQRTFTFGWTTDGALHAAISHAFASWPGARPTQVLLIGEASEYWWQIDHPRDDVAPNLVPVHGYANPEMLIRGDDGLVIVGGAGRVADMEIGRIPAQTPDEVRRALAIVRQYESAPPQGAWRHRHLIVSDDEEEFTRVAERLAIGSLFDRTEAWRLYLHEHPYEDYFRIFQRKRSIAATESLISSLSEGALTATYIGHGGPNIWSPRRLLHMRDIARLTNGPRRPLLIAGSCDTAWLDFPIEPVRRSLAERFVLAENGGAIAAYAPVAGATSHEHDFLLRSFYDAMLDHPEWEVGRLALASKLGYLLHRQDPGVPAQYVLLGDPALRLAHPDGQQLTIEVEASNLFTNTIPSVLVRGTMGGSNDGEGAVWLEDRTGRPATPPHNVRLRDGRFTSSINLTDPLQQGSYSVVARFTDGDGRVHRANHRLSVAPLPVDLQWSRSHAAEDRAHMEARATLHDVGTAANVVLEIRRQHSDANQLLATIPLTRGVEATWLESVPLEGGINVFIARIVAEPQSPNPQVLSQSVREVPRSSESLPLLDFLPASVTAEPNTVDGITSITMRLMNLTDKTLEGVGAEIFLLNGENERRLGHFPRGFLAIPGEPLPLAWRANEVLSPGNHRIRLRMVARIGDNGEEQEEKGESPDKEENEEIVSFREFNLRVPTPPRLEVVPGSIIARGDGGYRGETVFVSARIRNTGAEPIDNAIARLFLGHPNDGGVPAPSATGEGEATLRGTLAPGGEQTVQLRWDPNPGSPAQATLVVIAGTLNRPADISSEEARGAVTVTQRDLPNLAMLRDEMHLSRDLVRPGDAISIQVPFINDTAEDFDFPFLVEVRAQGPLMDDIVILKHEVPRLAAGQRIDLPATWRADGQRTRIHAVVNEEREFGEQRGDDNEAHRNIAYVLPEENLAAEPNSWTFAPDRHLGTHANTRIDPGDRITIARRPSSGAPRTFDNSMVVGDPIPMHGPGTNTDGLMAFADGALYWTIHETPQPVRLNIPLPDNRATDVVDVYLTQLGPGYVNIDQSNGYKVRFNDDEWIANPNRREVDVYFGRFTGADGVLTMEVAADGDDPTWNTISAIRMDPVEGTYTSPIYEMARFPGGTFAPRFDAPTDSTIRFEVRTSNQPSLEPEFTPWGELRPGLRLPPDATIRMLQWRVRLGAGPTDNPKVEDAAFEFAP